MIYLFTIDVFEDSTILLDSCSNTEENINNITKKVFENFNIIVFNLSYTFMEKHPYSDNKFFVLMDMTKYKSDNKMYRQMCKTIREDTIKTLLCI